METLRNYIGGDWSEPAGGDYLDNLEPATGRVISRVPASDERDIDRAVDAARRAFPEWSASSVEQRANVLLRIADGLEQRLEELATDESADSGKPLELARTVDIPRAIKNFRFFATAILHFSSESHLSEGPAINYTLRRPRGVAGCISPWNLPLYLFSWKVAPAIATGNTAVGKPSELTPVTATRLCEVLEQAGLPPGVLNVVHGTGPSAGAPLTAHPQVQTITFTGGTATGAEIARTTGPMFKQVSLELGGKNPNIVFADADMRQAIDGSIRAAFTNQGQVCLCGSRIFVQRRAYDEFVDAFVARARALRVGDPLSPSTDQGAVVSRQHFDKVISCIELAREEGGEVLAGGRPAVVEGDRCQGGLFIEPTVITGLRSGCRTNQEEIFGPVVTIQPFDDEEQALADANSTRYGLSATVWTQNLARAHRVAELLEVGTVWVNCWLLRDLRVPFGGTKSSGVGREGGEEALRFFTEPKNVCIRY